MTDEHDPESGRSPWAWVLLGAMAVFAVLVPSSFVAVSIVRRFAHGPTLPRAPLLVASVACLGLASFVGGYVVGRFGGGAGRREATLSGLVAGLGLAALAAFSGGPAAASTVAASLLVLLVTVPIAAFGGHRGLRGRRADDEPA